MYLKEIKIEGFKSFSKKSSLTFEDSITAIVGPNGSGKSNVTEAFRFVLGEQSIKTLRGKKGEDLIFNGGAGVSKASRAKVEIVFDNKNKKIDSSYDEIIISRTVFKDGTNEYGINGTQVKHRDILEFLSKANIGSTGHNIISQGEADKILNANGESRKEMIEDSLGLKVFQFRKKETIRKLEKTKENLKESDIRLREINPHLKYLEKQIEKYNRVRDLKNELKEMYATYISQEIFYIKTYKDKFQKEFDDKLIVLKKIDGEIEVEKNKNKPTDTIRKLNIDLEDTRKKSKEIAYSKNEINKKIALLTGEINALESISSLDNNSAIDKIELSEVFNEYSDLYDAGGDYKQILGDLLKRINSLLNIDNNQKIENSRVKTLKKEIEELQTELNGLDEKGKVNEITQKELENKQEDLLKNIDSSDKNILELMTKKNEIDKRVGELEYKLKTIGDDEIRLKQELDEGFALLGNDINLYKEKKVENVNEERYKQKERQKKLERTKISIETIGTNTDEDVINEYEELKEKVGFLNKEKEDLLQSIKNCEDMIEELDKEVETKFKKGIALISKEFDNFFKILFGGGTASVNQYTKKIEKADVQTQVSGVDIKLSLPRKKIHSMEQLSGGERALISIALLFAITQITPPPFLILDETDAALDESNSKRYGDMIERLSKNSQLILVTHNRETMYRATTLYGITMNSIGVSNVLSIKFEEAVAVAK